MIKQSEEDQIRRSIHKLYVAKDDERFHSTCCAVSGWVHKEKWILEENVHY